MSYQDSHDNFVPLTYTQNELCSYVYTYMNVLCMYVHGRACSAWLLVRICVRVCTCVSIYVTVSAKTSLVRTKI